MVGYWNINKSNSSSTTKAAFVTTTDHSMLHKTQRPPLFTFPTSPALRHPPPPPTPPYLRPLQLEAEHPMEAIQASALKEHHRPEIPDPCFVLPDDAAWVVEHGGVLSEFSVDDLLDFDGLEPDKETEHVEAHKTESFEEGETTSLLVDPSTLSDINLPTHDPAEFEWMSSIMDDSYPPPCNGEALPVHRVARPPVPVPVPVPVKAKRSKRSRAAGTTWPGFSGSLLSDTSNTTTTTATTTTASPSSSASSSPSYSSHFLYTDSIILYDSTIATPPRQPKKRGRKPKQHHKAPPHRAASAGSERHCTHCGTMKTPQWRTGPLGPKTLCNACGVRFKSGRLVPEYRPAASPTFVSHVHSNSHRKVLEMRRKKEEQHVAAAAPPVASF